MSAHKFWRLEVTESTTDAVMLDEVEFIKAGALLSVVPNTVTATSTYSSLGFTPQGLFDGLTTAGSQWSRGWHSDGQLPQALTFEFLAPVDLDGVRLQQRSDYDDIHFPTAMNLAYSDDGLSWSVLWSITGMPATRPRGAKVAFDTNGVNFLLPAAASIHRRLAIQNLFPYSQSTPLHHHVTIEIRAFMGGNRVSGTVSIQGTPLTPVARRVRLFDLAIGALVAETVSDPVTGAYSFDRIAKGRYFVVAHDHTEFYNAVIMDRIDSEPAP